MAWEMHVRGVPDEVILEALATVRRLHQDDEGLESHFGTPEQYAALFPATDAPPTSRWAAIGGVLAVLWILGSTCATEFFGIQFPGRPMFVLTLLAMGLIVVGLAVGFGASRAHAARLARYRASGTVTPVG